ncbi:plastocyanin/azurin family copper-binding protein [Kitasatospora sp. SUK 42]|uniref:cupredoxin domain-containing protein n=1 Tax=Kitasatospora sp. SUK 42 TaxID=1588882 RepID=UPI0018CA6B54|nr:cupredoxin family copper-binding protein [Kitasatospora sp. SUK 42]MBV2152034.1 cupredoxin domain-containing protein [Kitasatospora sp. SUK 42]
MNASSSPPLRRSRTARLTALAAVVAAVAGALGLLSACGGSSHPEPATALSPGAGQTLPGLPGATGTGDTVTATPPPGTSPASPAGSPASPTSSPASAPATANAVSIKNFAFSPAELTVKVGTKVTWTNTDPDAHTVTSKQGSNGPLQSAALATNDTYSYTFTTPGTYAYYCSIHPFMTATVVVTP